MSSDSLQQWLQRLETLHPTKVELGLQRITAVANALDLLPLSQPVVTVAGTNGKGSTVAVLEALIHETGRSTGTFTSPHFQRFNERIRVAGEDASDTEIVDAFVAIDAARKDVSLTYFEFSALAALLVFKSRQPDIVILEVGLGGRLDAVNMVDASVAVITSIDLDHQDWLGDSRGEIAREKAGILRHATPVVIAEPAPPAQLLDAVAAAGAVPALYLGQDFTLQEEGGEWRAMLQSSKGQRAIASRPTGSILPVNICAALQSALLLGIEFNGAQLDAALAKAAPMGRRQSLTVGGINYILDVAHNPASVVKLLEYIDSSNCNKRLISIFSVMSDKDVDGIVKVGASHFDAWFLADQPHNERAASAAEVAKVVAAAGQGLISVSKNLRQALRRAQSIAEPGDTLVVFGSFHTVAEILPRLHKDQQKNGVQ